MQLGLTLLGGGYSGQISAAGVTASCVAQATDFAEVIRHGFSSVSGLATASGTPVVAKVASGTATCSATGAADAGTYSIAAPVIGQCTATVSGAAQISVNCSGNANASATLSSSGFRLTRGRLVSAWGYATGVAQGETYQVGVPNPGLAFAEGYGTTNHLGYGLPVAVASGQATCVVQRGGSASGAASAVADLTNGMHQHGGEGELIATASGRADPIKTSSGIKYTDGNGEGVCVITGLITHVAIYQSQTGVVTASAIAAVPVITYGAKGHGIATASAAVDPLVYGTGATPTAAGAQGITATGNAKAIYSSKGTAVCSASGTADGEVKNTKVLPAIVATASAVVTGGARCIRLVYSQATGVANSNVAPVKTTRPALISAVGSAQLANTTRDIACIPAERILDARGNGIGYKTVLGASPVVAVSASASGYNWVNQQGPGDGANWDKVAPESRTLRVAAELREVSVIRQVRLVAA